jgi:hypothetical protein
LNSPYDQLSEESINVLLSEYKISYNELKSKIAVIYQKYSKNGKLSFDDMQKYSRMKNLMESIRKEFIELGKKTIKNVEQVLTNEYNFGWLKQGYMMEVAIGTGGFGIVNPKLLIKALDNQFTGYPISERVTNLIGDIITQIRQAITRGLIQGESYPTMTKRIIEIGNKNAWMIQRIIRTEAHRIQNQANLDVTEEAQSKGHNLEKYWVTAQDDAVRDSHEAMHNQKADKEGYFYSPSGARTKAPGGFGIPEEDINCFTGDTMVVTPTELQRAYKRYYEGDLIEITTAKGINISATPNHPILTDHGWVALKDIKTGFNVICTSFSHLRCFPYSNINYKPTMIAKIFDFIPVKGSAQRVRSSTKQFHGDGFNSQVYIKNIDSKLRNNIETSLLQPSLQNIFTLSNLTKRLLNAFSSLYSSFNRLISSNKCFVSFFSKFFSFFKSKITHSKIHRLASVSLNNSNIMQPTNNSSSGNLEEISHLFHRHSTGIFIDNVIGTNIKPFSGHVYNLQTEDNYYLAGIIPYNDMKSMGIIAHNCRCNFTTKLIDFDEITYSKEGFKKWLERNGRSPKDIQMFLKNVKDF